MFEIGFWYKHNNVRIYFYTCLLFLMYVYIHKQNILFYYTAILKGLAESSIFETNPKENILTHHLLFNV